MKKIFFFLIVGSAFAACTKTQFSPVTGSTGSANFSTFISVGNSLTQGYMDGGLYAYGQSNSYPAIIAKQIQMINPSIPFSQPAVTGNGSGYIHLVYVNNQFVPVQPNDSTYGAAIKPDPSWTTWGTNLQSNQYNNLGVSGILLNNCVGLNTIELTVNAIICGFQSIPPYGNVGNPYGKFLNFGSIFKPVQYIDLIRASKATFFTCWLGNNDVLGYATSGGVVNRINIPTLGSVALNDITSPTIFAQKYDSILTAFSKLGAKGVCATIPDVTSIPFFNTVPSYITVNSNQQFLYITTATGVRQATMDDHILLTAYDSVLNGQGLTASRPLSNGQVLDVTEVDSVETALTQYNASIKSLAASFGFAVVDMYQYLNTLQKSEYIDGVNFSRQFIQGGAFGLDGVHPCGRGYALIANQFIQAINTAFGASIPPADVTQYKSVIFP